MHKLFHLLALIVIVVLCASCAGKGRPGFSQQKGQEIADLANFPQNLEVYAKENGGDTLLLDSQNQQIMYDAYIEKFFAPWSISRTSISKKSVQILFKKARGYKNNGTMWTQYEWNQMLANANLGTYPNRAQHAIVLRNTDLRELPTTEARFSEPTPNVNENPFDYFQYSQMPIGMPLFIAHVSRDGAWYYIETTLAGGWVKAADVAPVDDNFKKEWRTGNYLALTRDNVILPGTGLNGGNSTADIGTVLPYANHELKWSPLLPRAKSGGFAEIMEAGIPAGSAVSMPMPITPNNVAGVGNGMMGQPYGWGGMLGLRDCSSLTRDLFTPFGIWLPRNSAPQAKRGSVIPLTGLTPAKKEKVILQDGVPFLSLVGMRGHIMLYVGDWKGRAAIFHNIWGIRTTDEDSDNERQVIGRAVVTSITPGMELKNLYRPVTFVDRLKSLNNLGSTR